MNNLNKTQLSIIHLLLRDKIKAQDECLRTEAVGIDYREARIDYMVELKSALNIIDKMHAKLGEE